MKKIVFVVVSLLSLDVFADCSVLAKLDNIYKVECSSYLGQSTLFDKNSNEYIILKSNNQILMVDGGESSFDVGSTLFLNPQVKDEVKPIAIDVSISESKTVFDPLNAKNYRLFAKGFSYQYENTSADFSFNNTNVDVTNNSFKTLPLAFQFELIFDNYGLMLSPDFENEAGEIIFYKTVGENSVGLHAKVSLDNENSEVTSSGTRLQDDDISRSDIQIGLYFRLENEIGTKLFFLGESRVGYVRSVEKAFNNLNNKYQELIIDAGFAQFEPNLYYQVSNNFKLGVGAGVYYGKGMMQIRDQSGVVSDAVTLMSVGLYPVKLLMSF